MIIKNINVAASVPVNFTSHALGYNKEKKNESYQALQKEIVVSLLGIVGIR